MTSKSPAIKIISTLGPASLNSEFLTTTAKYGQTHFRMNASHLKIDQISEYLNFVNQQLQNVKIDSYLDLPGKKMRIGHLINDYPLQSGNKISFVRSENPDHKNIAVPHKIFFQQVKVHDLIYLQDAQIQLKVVETTPDCIKTRVIQGGNLRSHAGIIIHQTLKALKEYLPEQLEYIQRAKELNIDYLALSYITQENDISELRQSCEQISYFPKIIAKIEHPDALNHLETICEKADEIWYCRGDLGSFISPWELMEWQTKIIQIVIDVEKPIFVAGQVFQYLTDHASPSRSEVIHFMQLIRQGIHGIVLSDETAIGKNSTQAAEAVYSLLEYFK
jgi:pyruvate kinase